MTWRADPSNHAPKLHRGTGPVRCLKDRPGTQTVPKLRLSDSTTLDAYRRALLPPEQKLFDQIVFSLKQPSDELAWYHHLGGMFGQLQSSMKTRKAAHSGLAEALGPGESLFLKSQRLVKEYPSQQSLAELVSIGADWTRLTLAFRISDKRQRLDLLRRAKAKSWSIPEFREQLESSDDCQGAAHRASRRVRRGMKCSRGACVPPKSGLARSTALVVQRSPSQPDPPSICINSWAIHDSPSEESSWLYAEPFVRSGLRYSGLSRAE